MVFEMGLQGLGVLILLSLGFGVISQLVLGRATTRWLWMIGSVAFFVGGLFMSEVLFGTATIDEIQPIIDGLAFDEALLGGLGVGLFADLVTWYATRRSRLHQPAAS